jgi:hypothetical protein
MDRMYTGVIQCTLRYIYKISVVEGGGKTNMWKAEGAVFATTVLPQIHATCESPVLLGSHYIHQY